MSSTRDERGGSISTIDPPRARATVLAIATATVLCLHAAVLLWKLDVSAASHAVGARAMTVRWLPVIEREASIVAPHDRAEAESVTAVLMDASDSHLPARLDERASPREVVAIERAPPVEPGPRPLMLPARDVGLAPEPDYLLAAHMDPGPRPLGDIEPEYPESANLQEGKVVLRLLISDTGVVDNVAVVRAEPKGLFENAALEAFRVARFSPGMISGTPVKSQITVEVEFLPINRGARISGRTY